MEGVEGNKLSKKDAVGKKYAGAEPGNLGDVEHGALGVELEPPPGPGCAGRWQCMSSKKHRRALSSSGGRRGPGWFQWRPVTSLLGKRPKPALQAFQFHLLFSVPPKMTGWRPQFDLAAIPSPQQRPLAEPPHLLMVWNLESESGVRGTLSRAAAKGSWQRTIWRHPGRYRTRAAFSASDTTCRIL